MSKLTFRIDKGRLIFSKGKGELSIPLKESQYPEDSPSGPQPKAEPPDAKITDDRKGST